MNPHAEKLLPSLSTDDLVFARDASQSKLEQALERGDDAAVGRLRLRINALERELARRAPKPTQPALGMGRKP